MYRYALVTLLAVSANAFAATPIDETIDGVGEGTLDVTNVAGSVTIRGTDQNQVRVTGALSDDADRIDLRRDGDRVIVAVIMPEKFGRRGRVEDTTLEIQAPRAMSLEAKTVSASLDVEDIEGEQELSSVSGSIETTLREAEISARTVSGSIHVTGQDGRTRTSLSSVSGNVHVEAVGGELDARTVSGRIEIDSPMLERSEAKSVSGSILIDAVLADDARLTANTTSGRITLNMGGTGAGRYEISTFSGTIDNCFGPQVERPEFGPPSSTLRFEEGDADARVSATSMSGHIELCRER
jgi:hypothetical protein